MRQRTTIGAYARRQSPKSLQKQKKAQAVKIKKAQTLLKQAHNLIKSIEGHEELDLAKYALVYGHTQMSRVTEWLDGTGKDSLVPLEAIEVELEGNVQESFILPSVHV